MDAVYKITNTENDKVYIGYSSRGATDRWYQHCANAFKKFKRSRLYSAMRKYGKESFVVETVYEGKDALSKENEFIIEYNSKDKVYGYNMTDGGEANQLGRRWNMTEEQKQKMRKPKPPRSVAHRKALSEAKKGIKWGTPFQQQPDDKVSAHALYMREYRKRDK